MDFGPQQFAVIAGILVFLALLAFVRVTLAKRGLSNKSKKKEQRETKAAPASIVKRTKPRPAARKGRLIQDVHEPEDKDPAPEDEVEEPEEQIEVQPPAKRKRKTKAAAQEAEENGNGSYMGDLVEFAERAGFDVPITINPEIKAVAQASPRAAIPLAWAPVENELDLAVKRLRLVEKGEETDAFENIKRLSDAGAVNPTAVSLLHKMRQLRNSAAHDTKIRMPLTTEDAISYSRLAMWLEREIGGKKAT
ncbi:MAG: DUF4145 domain-containing protein [SAR202 cluster bacterium]|nr:DUF4145 domain-containing protein [SAR202 cluster bacterium]